MERFSSIYPFTTENIAGYMEDLDLQNKRVITVTGSSDHIINAILKGATNITTFDINSLTKYYMELKLEGLKHLNYEDFLQIFLYNGKDIDYNFIINSNMGNDSKDFWIHQLSLHNNWTELKKSILFNRKHFNPNSKLWQNLYLDKSNYEITKKKIEDTNIIFLNNSLVDLDLDEEYDYMFLSNIADYLNLIYKSDNLDNYYELLLKFLSNVQYIYFAYLYDIGNKNPRSEIDDLDKVKKVFKSFEIKTFKSALENQEEEKDGVLILRRK